MERYVPYIPKTLKPGVMLVHNFVRPRYFPHDCTPGYMGFRAWITDEGRARLRVCRCGWAPHLPKHYRMCSVRWYRPINDRTNARLRRAAKGEG